MAEQSKDGSLSCAPKERLHIDGFVLAGGLSRRMGLDKSRLVLGGSTLLQRSASALRSISDRVYAVGILAQDSDGLTAIPDELVSSIETRRGSIVGLHSALKNATTPWVAVMACDMPFVSSEFFERLVSFIGDELDAVVPVQPDGRLQPLCALYRRNACLPIVEEMLATGEWKLQNLIGRVRTRSMGFEEFGDFMNSEMIFTNVNTPEEYEKAKALIGSIG